MRSDPSGIIGIARGACQRGDGGDTGRQLVHRRLTEYDRAGASKSFHLERIRRGLQGGETQGAVAGRHIDRVVVILDENGNAVQRPSRPLMRALPIQGIRLFQRMRIEHHDRVQLRAALIIGFDAGDISFHEGSGCDLPARLHLLQLEDRFLEHFERSRRGGRPRWLLSSCDPRNHSTRRRQREAHKENLFHGMIQMDRGSHEY
jgi:hypothetical protein